ncbi:PREDICTED: uncharacterized protein LOC104727690 [Camelina sativa]|uniref:Uncharacterized protein LOC104727690 n=1 Tax=Camelina sativa TaxID=90675 RepID=A0ABM0URM4_CAMSA|nr:PREDICTED: uncharacterized protein LOC104727690 [Camelina sativa]
MSMAIKFFTLFFYFHFVESSTAKNIQSEFFYKVGDDGRLTLRTPHELSGNEYVHMFVRKMEDLQREADEKYPLWKSTNYLERSLFLLKKAQEFVELWDERRKSQIAGNPSLYLALRNKVQGDLWPVHYDYCRQSEGTNILTYMMYDFCRQSEGANLLKYMTYSLSPEAANGLVPPMINYSSPCFLVRFFVGLSFWFRGLF